MHHDIALLQIQPVDGHGIVFSDYVQPACLPEAHIDGPRLCTVSGWGLRENNGKLLMNRFAGKPVFEHVQSLKI